MEDIYQELKQIKQQVICHICFKEMKLEKSNLCIDNYYWRCRPPNPKHDIRNGLYYLFNNCFINQYTINHSKWRYLQI